MNASAFLEDLKWRGLFQDMVTGTETYLSEENASGYIGFDPTADSLHLGSFQQIVLLKRMQMAGIRPIALMGGATGRVGDPTGKTEERQVLNDEILDKNIQGIKNQLSKFIQFGEQHIKDIAKTYHDWQQENNTYKDIPEYCHAATIEEIAKKDFSLVPSKYIEFVNRDENINFNEKMNALRSEFADLLKAEAQSKSDLLNVFKELGYEIEL
jgi:tyrosyl-tRNA synthetase